MAQQTVNGARAKVYVDDVLVGIYESVQRSNSLGVEAIHTLGRYAPLEIAINSYEAVQLNCSAFRVVGQGAHILPKVPKLQDLLNFERVKIDVVDRQTGQTTLTVKECVPYQWSQAEQAKQTTRFNVSYIGIVSNDESGDQDESAGATNFPA